MKPEIKDRLLKLIEGMQLHAKWRDDCYMASGKFLLARSADRLEVSSEPHYSFPVYGSDILEAFDKKQAELIRLRRDELDARNEEWMLEVLG